MTSASDDPNLSTFAKHTLMQQLRELSRNPPENCSVRLAAAPPRAWAPPAG
jgi:hypothetical protein